MPRDKNDSISDAEVEGAPLNSTATKVGNETYDRSNTQKLQWYIKSEDDGKRPLI